MSLSHSTYFMCFKNPLCAGTAQHPECITHHGMHQQSLPLVPEVPSLPVEAQKDSLPLLSPFLPLQAITTSTCLSSGADLCCVFVHEEAIQDHRLLLPGTQR